MIRTRAYLQSDLGKVLILAGEMHAESPAFRDLPFSATKVADLLDVVSADPKWLALVALDEDGSLVGFALVSIHEHFFCDVPELLDLAVYVAKPKRRSRAFFLMMRHIERWAKEMGAFEARFGITTGIDDEAAIRAFVKLGYAVSGTQVHKML